MGTPTYPKPNRAAQMGNLGVTGRRERMARRANDGMGNVDSTGKSSDNTPNLARQNQTRSGGRVGKLDGSGE